MPCREIIVVCSEISERHINVLCGHDVENVTVKPRCVYIVTTGFKELIGCLKIVWWLVDRSILMSRTEVRKFIFHEKY